MKAIPSDGCLTGEKLKRYADQPFNSEDMYRIPVDQTPQQPVVYQMPRQQDKRRKGMLGGKPYSIWSASKYILMISLMLYWLPLVGQMIGGFIGGRRAGSPFRAIVAAIIPVMILFGISTALQTGFIPIRLQNAGTLLIALVEQTLERLPIASPYVNFATTYVGSFIAELKTAASLKAGNYLITIALAYVGGILSDQSRRELEYVSRYGSPTTNILVSGREAEHGPFHMPSPSRFFHSLMPSGRQHETGFASLMPVPYSDNGFQAQGYAQPQTRYAPAAVPVQMEETEYHPGSVVRRRTAPEFRPRSWEDVYLRNMRIAGISGAGAGRRSSRASREFETATHPRSYNSPESEESTPAVRERAPAQPRMPATVRRDKIRDESTRRLVERALGKDYAKSIGTQGRRNSQKYQTSAGEGSMIPKSQPATVRKNGEWELL